jgi:RHS repeat-associated protein
MSDGSGTTTYSYDSLDRLTAKATPEGTLNYGYDAASNVASVTSNHVNGISVSYAHDQLNRLSAVTDGRLQGNQITTYAYDPASNVAAVNYANSVQSAMNYDALNRITGLATQSTGYLYQRGSTGNLTGATELNGRALAWTYDGIYRLTNETISSDPSHNNGTASYTLDPVGNRLSESTRLPGMESGSFGYNADDEVNTEIYDANGNTLATGGKTFAYDAENHLTSMNGGAATIVYDGDGIRVSKTVGGVTTQYLVDDLNPTGYAQVVEELVGGAVTRQYTYGIQRISQNQIIDGAWTPSFYGYDGGGNVRQLTNTAGAATDTYDYDAFGNKINSTGTTPNNYLYRGEQYDPDLGLYYLRARYYNPLSGRFMSRDPWKGFQFDVKTLHKYLYVGSNPVNYVDPRGRDLFEYAIQSNAAIPEARLVSIYGCVAGASFTAASLILAPSAPNLIGAAGIGGAVVGCVTLLPVPTAALEGSTQLSMVLTAANYFFCGASIWGVVQDLNDLAEGKTNAATTLVDTLGSLVGCVGTHLGALIDSEGRIPPGPAD